MSGIEEDAAAVRNITAVKSILDIVCQTTGMGFAAVARVTDEKWLACEVLDHVNFGLAAGDELPIQTTLCSVVRASGQEIVIDNVSEDPVYADHHTPKMYGLQSYIAVPITLSDGSFFGTLCAIDSRPARLKTGPAIGMFRLFAQLIGHHIDSQRTLADKSALLDASIETSALREQFMAVLGHDLRNPLAAVRAGTDMLLREPQTDKSGRVLIAMQQSLARMTGLIANMLDLARGLSGGIAIARDTTKPISSTIEEIVAETKAAHPDTVIQVSIDLKQAVPVDHARIGQMFTNLLTNAVTHGSAEQPIKVSAEILEDNFVLSVVNAGRPIPPDATARLFQPFYRTEPSGAKQGLGLGLYIASQIASSHGGSLDLQSDDAGTIFTFRMPLGS